MPMKPHSLSKHEKTTPISPPFSARYAQGSTSGQRKHANGQHGDEIKSDSAATVETLLDMLEAKSTSKLASYRESQTIARRIMSQLGSSVDKETLHAIFRNLILSQAAPDGSVARVIKYLGEMKDEDLTITHEDCIAILKVLAVHPDFVLRSQALQYMESSWFVLGDEAEHHVLAGLFRDSQLERAIEGFVSMQERGVRIERWLFDLAMVTLASQEELDDVLVLLKMRNDLYMPATQLDFDLPLLNVAVAKQHVSLFTVNAKTNFPSGSYQS
jgi:hypothetical protein